MGKKNEEGQNKEVEELKQKVADLENQLKRTLADYQNLEKRVIEDRAEWIKMANKQLLLRLLPSLDSLLLAEQHTQDKGVAISIKLMLSALREEGIEIIETKGKDFDPNTMECVQAVEGEEGKVVNEVKQGFTLYGKVLRPAQVTVGKINR